jgi:hypothetical protein
MEYDPEVEQAIEEQVPAMFRGTIRKGLEKFAVEKGVDRITMEIFLEAKKKYFGS